MAERKIQAIEYTCDGCGVVIVLPKDAEELPFGFHGTGVVMVHDAGGDSAKGWFACTVDCVTPAVLKAVGRDG